MSPPRRYHHSFMFFDKETRQHRKRALSEIEMLKLKIMKIGAWENKQNLNYQKPLNAIYFAIFVLSPFAKIFLYKINEMYSQKEKKTV